MIAGVCGGIATYFGVDPTLVRLIALLLLVVGNGATFIVYIIMAVVVPEEPSGAVSAPPVSSGSSAPPIPVAPPAVPATGPAGEAIGASAVSSEAPSEQSERAAGEAASASVAPTTTPWEPPVTGRGHHRHRGVGLGFFLIVLGAAFLAAQFAPGIAWWNLWPLVIVVGGLVQGLTPGEAGWKVYRFIEGLGTVAVGLVLLGNMTGYIAWSFWWLLLTLWPVLLIAAGFSILGKGTRQDWLRVVGSLVVLVAFAYAGAVSWSGASGMPAGGAWIVGSGGTPYSFSEPGAGVTKATLSLKGGAGDVVIESGSKLVAVSGESSLAKPTFSVSRTGDVATVTVSLGDSNRPVIVAPGTAGARMDVALSNSALWDLALETGASSVNADLSRVRVNDLQIRTGVSNATVKLGDVPDGVAAASVLIKAGVSSLRLLLPSGAEARVETQNGLGATHVGGRFAKTGDVWETPGYSSAGKGYNIRVESGISSVSVDTY